MKTLMILLGLLLTSPVLAEETHCVTKAVYFEAGNQSILGKVAVANVIRNRKISKRWPNTYCKVVKQRHQFTFYWDGKPEKMPVKDNPFEHWALFESRLIAWLVDFLPDVTHGSLFYHSDKIDKPVYWTPMVHYVTIGNHTFYGL